MDRVTDRKWMKEGRLMKSRWRKLIDWRFEPGQQLRDGWEERTEERKRKGDEEGKPKSKTA